MAEVPLNVFRDGCHFRLSEGLCKDQAEQEASAAGPYDKPHRADAADIGGLRGPDRRGAADEGPDDRAGDLWRGEGARPHRKVGRVLDPAAGPDAKSGNGEDGQDG